MHLSHLRVRNFRNLTQSDLEPPPGPILIWGDNAQGKTNLLESIYFLAAGRSFRARQDRECVSWKTPPDQPAIIRGTAQRETSAREIKVTLYQGEKRLFLDGSPLSRLTELIGELTVVLFTPADLNIVQGGPAARRGYLDQELCQISPDYLTALQNYGRALRQRNALLRSGRALERIAAAMGPFETLMAESAVQIRSERAKALQELTQGAAQAYRSFGAGERLEISYTHFLRNENLATAQSDSERYREMLEASRPEDLRTGATRQGPHRDDFVITLDGKSAHQFGSQGQQRSCVLALRVAEVEWMAKRSGEKPVLMLDDLGSELDPGRRSRLLETLGGASQVFLTATHPGDFPQGLDFAATWNIQAGEIRADR